MISRRSLVLDANHGLKLFRRGESGALNPINRGLSAAVRDCGISAQLASAGNQRFVDRDQRFGLYNAG
jgi:hypothetical protein